MNESAWSQLGVDQDLAQAHTEPVDTDSMFAAMTSEAWYDKTWRPGEIELMK